MVSSTESSGRNTKDGKVVAEFPEKLAFLWEDCRYKILYGGRGGAKSWGVARWLLIEGAHKTLRILCCRETQKSLADSVHRLLADQIVALGLESRYIVEKATIKGVNGTEFLFAGLRHNVANIKSLEAVDRVFIEEAQTVSKTSWQTLIPTVRKAGSQIIAVFNPDLLSDDTYQRFVVNPPPEAKVVKIGWEDNPFFPDVLRKEAEHLKATNPDEYSHVWGGNCISITAGAVYENELRLADAGGQITSVPYDRSRPVDCYWDLGYGDSTAIWMVQAMPFQWRVIDCLESSARPIEWYLKELQQRGYLYGDDWLPWDLGMHAKQMGSGKSIEDLMRQAGRKVRISLKLPVVDGINAARTIFGQCWFDEARCADGLQALRHYRWGETEAGMTKRAPMHDDNSHFADAWRYFAVAAKTPEIERKERQRAEPVEYSQWA